MAARFRTHRIAGPDICVPMARIDSIRRELSESAVVLLFTKSPGGTFSVQSSTNLTAWSMIGSGVAETNAPTTFIDRTPGFDGGRFYRLLWE